MKKLFLLLGLVVFASSTAHGQVSVLLSTSDTDVNAGSSLDMILGTSGSMYLWVINTDDGGPIDALGLDVVSSDSAILEATAHNIDNPNNRWAGVNPGEFNIDLGNGTEGLIGEPGSQPARGSNAFALIGLGSNGIANDGTPVLHSEVVFDATALGSTDLSVLENENKVSINLGSSSRSPNSLSLGTGTVNVIPEPGSLMVGVFGLGYSFSRRRRTS